MQRALREGDIFSCSLEGTIKACCTKNISGRRDSKYKGLGRERAGHTGETERTLRWLGRGKVREGVRK